MVQDDEEGGGVFKRMTSATHYIVPKAFLILTKQNLISLYLSFIILFCFVNFESLC